MTNFHGLQVRASPFLADTVPVLKLSPDVLVTDKFRLEFDQWLLDLFGSTKVVRVMGNMFFARPKAVPLTEEN